MRYVMAAIGPTVEGLLLCPHLATLPGEHDVGAPAKKCCRASADVPVLEFVVKVAKLAHLLFPLWHGRFFLNRGILLERGCENFTHMRESIGWGDGLLADHCGAIIASRANTQTRIAAMVAKRMLLMAARPPSETPEATSQEAREPV
jgi:hypothetical protein